MPGLLDALQVKQIVLNLWVFPTGLVTTARKIAVVVINICIEVTNVFTAWQVCSYLKAFQLYILMPFVLKEDSGLL